ncbi:helix-turn-helix domain-containing protein [Polymorphospora lycopeni]|uniref:Helix-turn-helix transcriptional regulator n=1 Tax=Polymorphospora lycopeni TaxID=3140240 RepID=A0ABV5CKU5_9ACTN
MPLDKATIEALAKHLRDGRVNAGLTQEQVAAATGIASRSIKRYESADNVPTLDALRTLVQALGIDPRETLVVLGFSSRDALDLPKPPPAPDPSVIRANRLFSDPNIPDSAKRVLSKGINAAIELWFDAFGVGRAPREAPHLARGAEAATDGV